jgi:hypothetical protein
MFLALSHELNIRRVPQPIHCLFLPVRKADRRWSGRPRVAVAGPGAPE